MKLLPSVGSFGVTGYLAGTGAGAEGRGKGHICQPLTVSLE